MAAETHDHLRPQHQTRDHYVGLRVALTDANRVAADLIRQVDGQLVIPAGEVEFLARRLQHFTRACLDAVPAGEA
jgi:hypothetical protein